MSSRLLMLRQVVQKRAQLDEGLVASSVRSEVQGCIEDSGGRVDYVEV